MSNNTFEYIGKIFNLKENRAESGWSYSFTIPIESYLAKDFDDTLWMGGIILVKERVSLDINRPVKFSAFIEARAPYGGRPATIGFIGFDVENVFK